MFRHVAHWIVSVVLIVCMLLVCMMDSQGWRTTFALLAIVLGTWLIMDVWGNRLINLFPYAGEDRMHMVN